MVRRLTLDLDANKIIQNLTITENLSVHKLHERLPAGVKNIETTLIYRPRPGNPDPGKPYEALLPQPAEQPAKKARVQEPQEDARLTDVRLAWSSRPPPSDGRTANRSKIFGIWRADDVTEWGDKRRFPVIANNRDIKLFCKLEHKDMHYALKEPESSLAYLAKQSGKELDEKKLTAQEKAMFDKAKVLEITNLVNSNAIQVITDPDELSRIRRELPHRIMPSRFIITKKAGELGEDWKAKARWILLGPDAMTQERFAPTPSSTTVMLCLQVISSMNYELYIMDVSSAFGQSDPHERAEGPLYASMPPTGIPQHKSTDLIRALTAVYGLVNAPAVWRKTVRRHLTELNYKESVFDPCLYYLPPTEEELRNGPPLQVAGVVLLDVDDFCQGGNQRHQELMNQLRSKLKFGKWRNVYKSSAEYIGRTLTQLENYEVQVSMKRYIEEKLKPVTLPRERLRDKSSKLTEQEITWLRGVGGSLLWIGKEARPDVGAACAMAMSWSSDGPTVEHILMANKTVNELKQTPDEVLRILPIEANNGIWVTVADALMANVENKSQGGFIVAFAHGSILDGQKASFSINSWKSHRLKRVIKATLGSEALAMDDALAEVEWVRALWHEVLGPATCVMDGTRLGSEPSPMVVRLPEEEAEDVKSIRICDKRSGIHVTDAKALYDLLSRRSGNAGHDRRAQIDVAVIHVSARALGVTTFWVPGNLMIADPLTKRLGNSTLLRKTMSEASFALCRVASEQ